MSRPNPGSKKKLSFVTNLRCLGSKRPEKDGSEMRNLNKPAAKMSKFVMVHFKVSSSFLVCGKTTLKHGEAAAYLDLLC